MTPKLYGVLQSQKITRKKLAEMIGMEYCTLIRKLNGNLPLLYSEVVRICDALGIDNPREYFSITRK